jgi:hypothetical protein
LSCWLLAKRTRPLLKPLWTPPYYPSSQRRKSRKCYFNHSQWAGRTTQGEERIWQSIGWWSCCYLLALRYCGWKLECWYAPRKNWEWTWLCQIERIRCWTKSGMQMRERLVNGLRHAKTRYTAGVYRSWNAFASTRPA